ncbi:MAG: GNAT family N-acetyltransferase [Devosia sp.]|jgi:GNAT superfamily N-acetyltransferase
MSDLLVRLYDLPAPATTLPAGVIVRRALPPERDTILEWIGSRFGRHWRSEAAVGLSQQPPTVFIAVRTQQILGFACYDGTAKGFFGPTGVDEAERGQGLGEALLMATLQAMAGAGYAYAIIGDPGPVEFYTKRLDALEIPGSTPGFYAGLLP